MKKHLRILALVTLLTSGLVGCGKAKTLSNNQIAENNRPGTVMIQTVHHAKFSVPDYTVSESKLETLVQSLAQRVKRGELRSEQQVFAEIMKTILADPLNYFEPLNEQIQEEAEVSTTGSASIVTEDGYIITNAHVVSSEQDELKALLASSALEDVATAGCQTLWDDFAEGDLQDVIGQTIGTDEFIQLCLQAHAKYYAHYMNLDTLDTEIYVALGASTNRDVIVEEGYKATVEAVGEPPPGKDVAILKIEANNLPTVELGSDESVTTGDLLLVLSYPGGAELAPDEIIQPSMTAGVVSAIKSMEGGWEVLQTDAAISGGSSGGPAFDKNGKVIGVATFGKVDPDTGAPIQGANFIVPMDVIEEFLKEADVEPKPSEISQLYQTAVGQYENNQFKRALKTFRQVNELNPDYPYVQSYISKTQEALN